MHGGARAFSASRMAILALAFILAPAFAAAPPAVATGNPRLANLEIEIWPEFDRPAALVFLKGEIAAASGAGRPGPGATREGAIRTRKGHRLAPA